MKQCPREKDRIAKNYLIKAYFKGLEQRTNFLPELVMGGHYSEALLLCCCYIEGLGRKLYWPNEKKEGMYIFYHVTKEHGEEAVLLGIHPKQLKKALRRSNKLGESILQEITGILDKNQGKLYTGEEILNLIKLTEKNQQRLKKQLWRGTLASLVYSEIRCKLAHDLSTLHNLTCSQTNFNGQPLPELNFDFLYPILQRILKVAKEKSLTSGKWYGHELQN